MEMLFYLVLGAMLYGLLADRTDRAIEREMTRRRAQPGDLHLEEEDTADLDLRPRDEWFVHRRRPHPWKRVARTRWDAMIRREPPSGRPTASS